MLLPGAFSGLFAQQLDPSRALSQYTLQNWQQEHGLPQNSVTAILQTRDGYIWLATYQGLVRFDGVRFKTYNTSNTPALGTNGIWALLEDQDGTLWIGTNGGGLVQYTNGSFKALTTDQGLAHNTVLTLKQSDTGQLWVGTLAGYSILGGEGKLLPLEASQNLSQTTIYDMEEIQPGVFWLATRLGLFQVTEGKAPEKLTVRADGVEARIISTLLKDRQGTVWVGTREEGLYQFDPAQQRFTRGLQPPGSKNSTINTLYEDPIGTLWVGTFGSGLNRKDTNGFAQLTARNGLADDDVVAILYDNEGSLWFGTKRAGLYRLKNSKFSNYGTPEGLSSDNTSCILQSKDGSLWVGTSNAGLNHVLPGKVEHFDTQNGMMGSNIRALYEDEKGGLWVSLYGKGVCYKTATTLRNYTTRDGLADIFCRVILPGEKGAVWFGTRNGLSCFQNGRFRLVQDPEQKSNLPILSMANGTRSKDELWLGSDGQGLVHLYQGTYSYYKQTDGLNSEVVLCLQPDAPTGAVWIGTNAGLNLLLDGSIKDFRKLGGVFTDAVLQIIFDGNGTFWLGTNNGIYSVSRQALLEYAKSGKGAPEVIRYDKADGMRAAECVAATHPGALRSADGKLWFPTIQGITVVDPALIAKNELPPPIHIEDLMVDGLQLSPADGVELLPGTRNIEIGYTGLSYMVPSKVHFKYRLQGFSDEWTPVGPRRTAYFTGLPPGTYIFQVIAENNDHIWSPAPASFSFTLLPFFYQTTWFLLLVIGIVLVGTGGALRWRWLRAIAEKRELEQKVAERTEEVLTQKEAIARRNAELGRTNTSLSQKTQALEQALISLQRAQDQLVASEKMAVLGQLVANIAHEINTPLSAVTSSARSTARLLPVLTDDLVLQLRNLDDESLRCFRRLIEDALAPHQALTTRQERDARAAAEKELEAIGATEPQVLAYTFAQLGLWQDLDRYRLLILRPDAKQAIELAAMLVGINHNNETISQASQRTSKIVRALKSYAYQPLKGDVRVPTHLSESLELVLTLYANLLRRGIEVKRDYQPVPELMTYADELEQVWTNLIHNAILAMDSKGVLSLSVRQQDSTAIVEIADTGAGISAEVLPRIFEPFFTTRPKGQGSGLGLDICRKIIEKHRGTIEVESRPGRTSFRVLLPIDEEQAL